MISHVLTIVINELNKHLADTYGVPTDPITAELGNIAEGVANGGVPREKLILSMVNIKEEKTLKNLPNYARNDITLSAIYENPPVFLNFQILISATHANYTNALLVLSRAIRFFQFKNVFTQDNVEPLSISASRPIDQLDQLEVFKLNSFSICILRRWRKLTISGERWEASSIHLFCIWTSIDFS